MANTQGRWRLAGLLVLGLGCWLAAPSPAQAGPYFGEWGWAWHAAKECCRGNYSPLHYWAPDVYKARAWVHPSHLDQYPPGPCPPVPPTFEFTEHRCPSIPPTPTSPYADPTAYYGRPVAPP